MRHDFERETDLTHLPNPSVWAYPVHCGPAALYPAEAVVHPVWQGGGPAYVPVSRYGPEVPIEEYPAPVTTSREVSGFPMPQPVMSLAEFAREAGWEVRVQYAQGYPPHSATGRPGALKDSIAVIFGGHPITDRQAYACYEKTASGSAWSWNGICIRGSDVTPYGGCGITELKAFLSDPAAPAHEVAEWVKGIKAVRAQQAAAVKARPKPVAKPREGMS